MDDKAAQAVRSKRDSSMRVGLKHGARRHGRGLLHRRQYRRGHGHRQDGAGHACRASTVRRWRPSCRPARAARRCCSMSARTSIPTRTIWCSSRVMGHMYARNVLRIAQPRVGLLSIGEEDSKGNSADPRYAAAAARAVATSTSSATSKAATCSTATRTSRSATALWAMSR